jgi:hypothetical protein
VTYKKGGAAATSLPSVHASCAGGISVSEPIAGGIARTDTITVCDTIKGCISETVTVV